MMTTIMIKVILTMIINSTDDENCNVEDKGNRSNDDELCAEFLGDP